MARPRILDPEFQNWLVLQGYSEASASSLASQARQVLATIASQKSLSVFWVTATGSRSVALAWRRYIDFLRVKNPTHNSRIDELWLKTAPPKGSSLGRSVWLQKFPWPVEVIEAAFAIYMSNPAKRVFGGDWESADGITIQSIGEARIGQFTYAPDGDLVFRCNGLRTLSKEAFDAPSTILKHTQFYEGERPADWAQRPLIPISRVNLTTPMGAEFFLHVYEAWRKSFQRVARVDQFAQAASADPQADDGAAEILDQLLQPSAGQE